MELEAGGQMVGGWLLLCGGCRKGGDKELRQSPDTEDSWDSDVLQGFDLCVFICEGN